MKVGKRDLIGQVRALPPATMRRRSLAATPRDEQFACAQCGTTDASPNFRGLCARCILDDIGVPSDAIPFAAKIPGKTYGERWSGFFLFVFGVIHDSSATVETEAPFLMNDRDDMYEFRHAEVAWPNSLVYVEMRWPAGQSPVIAIRGVEHADGKSDIDKAWQARNLLRAVSLAGRRKGSGLIREPEEVLNAYRECWDASGRRPSQEILADYMCCEVSTLKRFLRDNRSRVSWPPVR